MPHIVILASSSRIRSQLLNNAGIFHRVKNALIDEDGVKAALKLERRPPRDVADALADMKSRKISIQYPDSFIIGCDQVLVFNGELYSKPKTKIDMISQLSGMSGKTHEFFSSSVIYRERTPIWRHIGMAKVTLRDLSLKFIETYVEEGWDTIKDCTGGYKIEGNGVGLVKKIEGDYFSILGLPLLEIASFFETHGVLDKCK